jgi:hypothetical protein
VSGGAGYELTLASILHAAPEDVWERVGTVDGANLELAPWLRITAPRSVRRLEDLPRGERAFRAWVLLLGLVPVDADDVVLVWVEPLHGFLERSSLVSAHVWEHERTLARHREGTVLADRVRATPRAAVPPALHEAIARVTFEHRHRRLRAAFGGRTLDGL